MRSQLVSVLSSLVIAAPLLAPAQVNSAPEQPAAAQNSQPKSTAAKDVASVSDTGSSRNTRVRFGTATIGAGFFSGPAFYPYSPYTRFRAYGFYPYYALAWWNPLWAWYYDPADLAYAGGKGELELKADAKDTELYINGAYAGRLRDLKRVWLDPGAYDISLSAAGREPFERRLYVLTGKTLSIHAKLLPRRAP